MSSRRGALALSFSAAPKRASARATTKASSSAVRPSPSRPQPKCFSRGADISSLPAACGTIAIFERDANISERDVIRYPAIRPWLAGDRKFAMITKFDSLYAGHTDLDNIGYGGTPINE